jgi:hypothetical protein
MQAQLYALSGLIAVSIIGYLLLYEGDVPSWRYVIWSILISWLIITGWWFLDRLTNLPKRLRNKVVCFRLTDSAKKEWSHLVSRWLNYIRQGNEPHFWRIRAAIAKQYIEQEKLDLSGDGDIIFRKYHLLPEEDRKHRNPEGRPLIFTSFVRYSGLVEAIVKTAVDHQHKHKNSIILCITTLSMGLEKWLNFDDQAHAIYPEWERYLQFLRTTFKGFPNTILARIMLVRDPNRVNNRVNLRTIGELKNELRNWVWLTKKGPDYPEFSAATVLEPVNSEKRISILERLRARFPQDSPQQNYIGELEQYTPHGRDSYLILPRDKFPVCPTDLVGGEFGELGKAFISTYHSRKNTDGYHAYYSIVEPSDYIPDPTTDDPPYPLDLFYVAMVNPKGQPMVNADDLRQLNRTPLFCLAARPDDELHMVYLYLLDPEKCPRSFASIENYITTKLNAPNL